MLTVIFGSAAILFACLLVYPLRSKYRSDDIIAQKIDEPFADEISCD